MDPLRRGMIDSIPPIMRRYEEMVKSQTESTRRKQCCMESRGLGAPIKSDLDFLGITYDMTPSPDYVPVGYDELTVMKESMCTKKITPKERLLWDIDGLRRHGAFHCYHEILYFPMIFGRHYFETDFAKYLWLVRSCRAVPDKGYISEIQRGLIAALHRFKRVQHKVTINRLVLNDSIYCLKWFSPQSRHQIIKGLAETFREQTEVLWISAENAELTLNDGIRMLLAISITSGLTLDTLHIWHFFREGVLPITSYKDASPEDVYIAHKVDIGERTVKYFYFTFVMQANYTIPHVLQTLALHTAYSCLEYLKVLSVEYRYLSGGKGETMLYLGCLKNGTLRQLNILFTECDFSEHTQRYVCTAAWKKAYKICPYFRVNFVSFRIVSFSKLLVTLVQYIPLEGFYCSTGFKCDDIPLYFDIIVSTLTKHYKRFLKRLNIHLVRPRLRVDNCLSKLLMELPFLEELIYRGPIDSVTSLHCYFKYIEQYALRIKKLHMFLTEDPCQPEPYKKIMEELFVQYEPVFVDKGIDFKIGTCQC